MPRPPILPTLDFRIIFATADTYAAWLGAAEDPSHREKLEERARQVVLSPAVVAFLKALPRKVNVLALSESWCGDVHRHQPVLMKMAEATDRVAVRFLTREQSPDIFIRFLTNGGESVPKFVFLSEDFVECGNWGPMPEECRRLIARGKAAGNIKAARERVSKIYESDPDGEVVQRELMALFDTASCLKP